MQTSECLSGSNSATIHILMKTPKMLVTGAFLAATLPAFGAIAIHHYDFEGAGVIDRIGTANGSLNAGAQLVTGQLALDGVDDFVSFVDHIIPTSGGFTVGFFATATSLSSTYAEMISQGFSGGPGFYLGYNPSHHFRIGDLLQGTGIPFPSDGLAHHYAVTSGSDTRLYVDGLLLGVFGPITQTASGSGTRLGSQFSHHGEYFHGFMDDLWIFDGVLPQSEVAALVAVPEPQTTALVAGMASLLVTIQVVKERRKRISLGTELGQRGRL